MKKQFTKFVQLMKVDETKREVWGVLAEEVKDKSGEVFDYTSSKKYFQQWSDSFQKATDGKSYGNLRLMHQAIAVGKLVSIEFLDDVKKIYIGAKVTDDTAWKMVEEAVLTGFSIGGIYIDTWMVGKTMYYTAEPVEASIVDNPCMYGATFDAVKSAGDVEKKAFKFVLNTLVKDVVGNFIAGSLKKDMYCVSDLAYVLSYLNAIRQNIKYEEQYEGDDSDIPKRLANVVDELSAVLADYLAEETAELTEDEQETVVLSAKVDGIAKQLTNLTDKLIGQENPTEENVNPEELKKLTDGLSKLGEIATSMEKVSTGMSALVSGQEQLAKDIDALRKEQEGTDKVVASLAQTVGRIAGQPASKAAPTFAAVDKSQDGRPASQPAAPSATLTVPGAGPTKNATPQEEAAGKQASFEKLRDIHKSAGFMIGPGDTRFRATGN